MAIEKIVIFLMAESFAGVKFCSKTSVKRGYKMSAGRHNHATDVALTEAALTQRHTKGRIRRQ